MSSSGRTILPRTYSRYYIIIAAVFITCLITANIAAVKLVSFSGLIVPAGILVFPLSYIFGDVLTEVYGYREARRVIWLGFSCNLLAVVFIWLGQMMPAAPFWKGQESYEAILGHTPRVLAASFVAYLAGEFANSFVMAKMKIATRGRWLWTRTVGSTLVGQGIDSLFFLFIAFVGQIPPDALLSALITQWIFKSCYEALATPLTYRIVGFLKKQENLDVYDFDTNFNPFAFGDGGAGRG